MEQEKIIKIADTITVNELATNLNVSVSGLIGELFKNGIMATINQRIDFETVEIIIAELGFDNVKLEKINTSKNTVVRHQLTSKAKKRPPIVAIMGHVDHGKTSLLDFILQTKVANKEAGGITQYISAYQVECQSQTITFLDTPGHEAFAAVRQHGALLTDLVVIVVAADDGVMPQTVEAIKFAQSANAKIIVAINKIDKPGADINLVMSQLATNHNLNPEEWGGDTIMVPVSAKTGEGVDKLLTSILLLADMEELKADYDTESEGLIIEAAVEQGKGSVVRLLVQQGNLKIGDYLVAGETYGKVRTMVDFKGRTIKSAGPSTPVKITGFKSLPDFGQIFKEVKNEKIAKASAVKSRNLSIQNAASSNITSNDLLKMMKQFDEAKDFNVIIKADVQGSLASVIDSLKLIDTKDEIKLHVIHSGVGDISDNDVKMAAGSPTIIYGFNVSVASSIKQEAARAGVPIKIYRIIYELLDDAKREMEILLSPEIRETEIGKLKVKGVFKILKDSVVIGGQVTSGRVYSGLLARIWRDKVAISEVEVANVQKNQQDSKEIIEGEMCGMLLKTKGKIQVQIDDKIEFFKREIVPKKLS